MKFKDRLQRLGAMAATLPFHVEDMEAITQTFVRWSESHRDDDLKTIEVWLYCFTQRYVLLRLMRESNVSPSEVDRHIEYVFVRAREGMVQVKEPLHFTHWVRVVCRNAFLNGRRSRVSYQPLDESQLPDAEVTTSIRVDAEIDRTVIHNTVKQAIGRLPDSLQSIATMRLLENHSYEHIAARTDRPLPTVRTYVAKALRRLRLDPGVRALMYPFGEDPNEAPKPDAAGTAKRRHSE